MTLEQALAYLKPVDTNNGTISLRAPKAREAVAVIEAALLHVSGLPEPVPGHKPPPDRGWVLYGCVFKQGRMVEPGHWLPSGHPLLLREASHGL
ncbi:hypothetical protein [Methylorubrum zatmanii]|nr:hypothetical protein [Methylorubrum zatmanii]MBD8909687.1 hypothetical protein [Methylorubrum zatmanii]